MGKRKTLVSCAASLGIFVLGATVGAYRTRRRDRRQRTENSDTPATVEDTAVPCPSTVIVSGNRDSAPLASTSDPTRQNKRGTPTRRGGRGETTEDGTTGNAEGGSAPSLDCPVCLTEIILPRVAGCGHTVCTTCLTALGEHERRPVCPVCRRRIRTPVDKTPINFMVKACVEERVMSRGEAALAAYRLAEEEARALLGPASTRDSSPIVSGETLAHRLRPAWNWFKWTVIIVTEFGAFLVSLKEVLESTPARSRRFQRIV